MKRPTPIRMRRAHRAVALVLLLASRPAFAADFQVPLVWHVESEDGRTLSSREADRLVNPASVTKLATSLRALETLGPDHRFVTTVGVTASASGKQAAGLVVQGGQDPDFQFENAVLLAHALVDAGVARVPGDLFVTDGFWLGWERGTAGREPDEQKRRRQMAARLRDAWSPSSWSAEEKASWQETAGRHGWDPARPPAIAIGGELRTDAPPRWTPLVEHQSGPLLATLRRFNVFSNNDIERLDPSVGPASGLDRFLADRFGPLAEGATFSTSSGLNANRMSPRLVVALVRELRRWLEAHGHEPADLMPILGCGTSTLSELFPRLVDSGEADGLAGKTGTLNTQDGGVSALAGFLPTVPGQFFFVAAPGAGDRLGKARAAEEDWVRQVLLGKAASREALQPLRCPKPVPTSDALAATRRLGKHGA